MHYTLGSRCLSVCCFLGDLGACFIARHTVESSQHAYHKHIRTVVIARLCVNCLIIASPHELWTWPFRRSSNDAYYYDYGANKLINSTSIVEPALRFHFSEIFQHKREKATDGNSNHLLIVKWDFALSSQFDASVKHLSEPIGIGSVTSDVSQETEPSTYVRRDCWVLLRS